MAVSVSILITRARTRDSVRWRLTEPQVLFIVLFAVYFAAACYLALVANVIYGDAWSRVELAQRVIFSRDPHLAAIGFVWNPLPVLALLPFVALKFVWPQLVTLGLASGIVSAICMAGAAVQVRGALADMGLGRANVLILTGAFALHPLVFYFGANGMSEAMVLFFLLMAVRYLGRWLREPGLNSLITCGVALGLAYFSRYESLIGAIGITCVVATATFLRTRGRRGRDSAVLSDVVIVAAPTTFAFSLWAVASWLITGQAFYRLASSYSSLSLNSEKIYPPWSSDLIRLLATQLASLEPLVPLLLILGVGSASRFRARILALAPLAGLGATLGFMVVSQLNGSLTHELRYLIVLVPLTVLVGGAVVAGRLPATPRVTRLPRPFAIACVLTVVAALPVSAGAMFDSTINPYAVVGIQSVFSSTAESQLGGHLNWTTERLIAGDLDRMHLSPGTVLVDDYLGWPIVVTSSNPTQFVITSDRDFQSIMRDPKGTGVHYILVPQPSYFGNLDAVNHLYPSFFNDGSGIASLVREYSKAGINDSTWRLYRIN